MTDYGVVVLQNCTDVEKGVPGFCSGTCPTSSSDINQGIGIKAEEVSDGEVKDVPVPIEFQATKAELEVSCMDITSV
jgi:hypothetical protein